MDFKKPSIIIIKQFEITFFFLFAKLKSTLKD